VVNEKVIRTTNIDNRL